MKVGDKGILKGILEIRWIKGKIAPEIMANEPYRSYPAPLDLTGTRAHSSVLLGLPNEDPKLLVHNVRRPSKSSNQKPTSYHKLCLTPKSNTVLTYLCICLNFRYEQ